MTAVKPQQIILFGSHGRDEAQPDSDIDFLIITPQAFGQNHSRRQEAAKVWRKLAPFGIPTDFLIYSAEEVKHWQTSPNHIISIALAEGKVMYERSPTGSAIDERRPAGSESPKGNAE